MESKEGEGETVTISLDMDEPRNGTSENGVASIPLPDVTEDEEPKGGPIEIEQQKSGEELDKASLFTGWIMLGIAIALFVISFSIAMWGLDTVFANKRFPSDTDTPCYLAFMVMGTVFLVLGMVYRDMAVHPEIFENVKEEKSEYLKKREEWERIKQRVRELECSQAKENGGASGTEIIATGSEKCDE